MNLIPFDRFTVETNDPIPIVAGKLSEKLDHSWFRLPWYTCKGLAYAGSVWENGFKIIRVLNYRNSFQPVICGRFEAGANGTVVRITMRPSWIVLAFLIFWSSMIGSGAFGMLAPIYRGEIPWYALFFPAIMVVLALGLTTVSFWF